MRRQKDAVAAGDAHGQSSSCRSWSTVYNTATPSDRTNSSLEQWHTDACPWEDTRHSGFFNDYRNTSRALAYAARHVCLPHTSSLKRLAGARIYFLGDSVLRQFAQSFLCRIRHPAGTSVLSDEIAWSVQQIRSSGRCARFSGANPLRHCFMRSGCVTFQHDVRVCYEWNTECKAPFVVYGDFRKWLDGQVAKHGAGTHTYVLMSNGLHQLCREADWFSLNATYERSMKGAAIPASRFTVIYKDLDAQHFPTPGGGYLKQEDRARGWTSRGWYCRAAQAADPPQRQRNMELRTSLPVVQRLGWQVLRQFEASKADGHDLHSTTAPVAESIHPVDCSHWMLPGVPDVWTDRLLRMLVRDRGRD